MVPTALHVLFYAVIAAASPLALAATLVVIRNAHPRVSSIAFTVGFLVGATAAAALGLALGDAAVNGLDSHETVEAVIALLLGLLLLGVGVRARRHPERLAPSSGPENPVLSRLRSVSPAAASAVAGMLGFGGPKRLVITFLAMSLISGAVLGDIERVSLVVLYVAVASVLVWLPVTMVLVSGERGTAALHRVGGWLERHAEELRVVLGFAVGGALVLDGIVRLVA